MPWSLPCAQLMRIKVGGWRSARGRSSKWPKMEDGHGEPISTKEQLKRARGWVEDEVRPVLVEGIDARRPEIAGAVMEAALLEL